MSAANSDASIPLSGETTPLRVLCVDDSEIDYCIFSALLTRTKIPGCVLLLEHVDDADRARERMFAGEHDLYFVDWRLGNADGIALVEDLRARGWYGPVAFLTGSDDPKVLARGAKAGALQVLNKGELDGSVLRTLLTQFLTRRSAA